MSIARDHGGGLDAAIAQYGGTRSSWIDLSTGINPIPYPIVQLDHLDWTALPDRNAFADLEQAARKFWNVPERAAVLAAPGASSLIARIPVLAKAGTVRIEGPTYNEHAAAFQAQGWEIQDTGAARVMVHPNNPDGRLWSMDDIAGTLCVVDESFCDVSPEQSLIASATEPGVLVLKSFGKFWGLAGLRLGFAIGDPELVNRLRDFIGPWAVSGPALRIGAHALHDIDWAEQTRTRLSEDSARLDQLMHAKGAALVGGTPLFRLYNVDDAAAWQARLARLHIWSRIFPYSRNWIRLGLPAPHQWDRIEAAL